MGESQVEREPHLGEKEGTVAGAGNGISSTHKASFEERGQVKRTSLGESINERVDGKALSLSLTKPDKGKELGRQRAHS